MPCRTPWARAGAPGVPAVTSTPASDHALNRRLSDGGQTDQLGHHRDGERAAERLVELAPAGGADGVDELLGDGSHPGLEPVDEPRRPRLLQQPSLPRVGRRIGVEEHPLALTPHVGEPVAPPAGPGARRLEDVGDVVTASDGVEVDAPCGGGRGTRPQGGEVRIGVGMDLRVERVVVQSAIPTCALAVDRSSRVAGGGAARGAGEGTA